MSRRKRSRPDQDLRKLYTGAELNRARIEAHRQMRLPVTVRDLVQAICADHERRENEMRRWRGTAEQRDMWRKADGIIADALDLIDPALRGIMLDDISHRRGYEKSRAHVMMSRKMYYSEKNKVETAIAYGLWLII